MGFVGQSPTDRLPFDRLRTRTSELRRGSDVRRGIAVDAGFALRFANGKRKRVRFSPNRDASAVMLADLLKKIENEKAGVVDRFADHKRPLTEHLGDWEKSLVASGRGEEYVTPKRTRVRNTFEGCGWTLLGDMTADRLETFLLDLREKQQRSVQTSNDWLQAVRQFVRWTVANDRHDRDPFARLKPGNAKLNRCRRRGEFTVEEIGKLLDAAAGSTDTFRGLSGPDRRMLYRVALGTGFRAAELAALVPDSYDLDANPPAVILPAEFTKNRKGATQPLSDELAAELRTYLKGRARKGAALAGDVGRPLRRHAETRPRRGGHPGEGGRAGRR